MIFLGVKKDKEFLKQLVHNEWEREEEKKNGIVDMGENSSAWLF